MLILCPYHFFIDKTHLKTRQHNLKSQQFNVVAEGAPVVPLEEEVAEGAPVVPLEEEVVALENATGRSN